MNILIQLLFSLDVPALTGTAFDEFSQIGIDPGNGRSEARLGPGINMDILGVATA